MPSDFLKDKDEKKKLETPTQHLTLGRYYLMMNDLDGAIKEFAKATLLDSNYLEAHYSLAEAYFVKATEQTQLTYKERIRWLIKASKHYHKIIILSPESQMAQKAKESLKNLQDKLKKLSC